MADLTVQTISLTGLEETFASADVAGDSFVNDGRTFFHIVNADASDHTVTFDSLVNCDQGVDHDSAIIVTAGEERLIGPFVKGRFNDSDAKVSCTYDAVTAITVAAIKLPLSSA